jgi:hypothetical protein
VTDELVWEKTLAEPLNVEALNVLADLHNRFGGRVLVQAFIACMSADGTRVLVRLSQGTPVKDKPRPTRRRKK